MALTVSTIHTLIRNKAKYKHLIYYTFSSSRLEWNGRQGGLAQPKHLGTCTHRLVVNTLGRVSLASPVKHFRSEAQDSPTLLMPTLTFIKIYGHELLWGLEDGPEEKGCCGGQVGVGVVVFKLRGV